MDSVQNHLFTITQTTKHLRRLWLAGLILICTTSFGQSDNNPTANAVLRRAVEGELKAQADDHSHWMYRLQSTEDGKEEVKLVVESKDGELQRLQSVNGQPISAEQQSQEETRISNFLHSPDRQKKRQRAQSEDAEQTARMFKVLPDALNVRFGQRKGDLVELLFEPNPNYHAWSREAIVFHEMEGRIWVDTRANRLAEIEGHLMQTVKFGGGLFGYLDKGGEFNVRQAEVAPGHWEVTLLHVNMHGKILFLRTISEQQHEIRSDYKMVSNDLTMAQAAEELQKRSSIQDLGDKLADGSRSKGGAVSDRKR